ncbi:adenosine deaminase [Oceanospirillum linum]|uniref:Adenine deaminase n=1 Tax=Oceanospirillum linum TaxID=966 RepID=A0A1T1HEB9_OCELI|nr:adenosine deaminase [Oceanospirillum linum]OOV88199.1 adenosine deaminase [Oceanospirillum linum]SEF47418.1 adenosine deaminase [Oleiphilus messinensis]SMP02422.1 adenosine deaminase [Oceanospirillum linum]
MTALSPKTPPEIARLIQALPKAELHLHIEGSFEPELMFAIAKRNRITLSYDSVEALKEAYQFNNLQEFLDLYYQGMNVLQTRQDYYDLTRAYLDKVHSQNVRHVEIFWDPQGHLERGIDFATQIDGILQALKEARAQHGISYRLIMSFLRHLPEESAFETLELAKPYLDEIYGVGLDSSEMGHPPEKFQGVFAACRDLGLRITAHAGEEGPADYVWQALDLLQVDRVDHGNRSLEDDTLIERLKESQMVLTVCPLSNLKLQVVKDLNDHPIPAMLQAGLKATINSDDPAYFGGYMNENLMQLQQAVGLSADDIITLTRNSIEGSWAEEARKKELLAELDRVVADFS